jgi:formyl-CoA transferase
MEVIRIEHPVHCDPNRKIGFDVLGEELMNAYYLCINAGKKAITLNLAEDDGRELFHSLVEKSDVFITNQLPRNYRKLGIDYETLKKVRPDLIWLGVTGFGPEINEGAYDPILQARSGLMEMTGEPGETPHTIGIPLPDMGASEHAYGLIMKALLARHMSGEGERIDLSMFESSVSWLTVPIALTASFGEHVSRRGNSHSFFCPVNVYRTRDGFIYVAVGNDRQWKALASLEPFKELDKPEYELNNGRLQDVENLHRAIESITSNHPTAYLIELLNSITVPVSEIKEIPDVIRDPLVKKRLLTSLDPKTSKRLILSPPPYRTRFLEESGQALSFPPRHGEHNREVYGDLLGLSDSQLEKMGETGVL